MPNQISNTASLTFEYGTQTGYASSNTALATLEETVSIKKNSLGSSYFFESEIFYILEITNNSNSSLKNIKITDDLGTYAQNAFSAKNYITPLSYKGPSHLYVNGEFSLPVEPEVYGNKLTFSISSIPKNSSALLLYKVSVNDKAPLETGSTITTTAKLFSENISDCLSASDSVEVSEKADVKIIKNMWPNAILPGEKLTYIFSLYNYGNTEALKVTLSDTFLPAPSGITVKINSSELPFSNYSYVNGTLNIPAYTSDFSLSIPAATFTQNAVTGTILTNPGVTVITVTGNI